MRIGIIGLGLIGGSLGRDLGLNPDHQIWGLSRNPSTCEQAIAIGAVHSAHTQVSQIPQLDQTDIIFVCTPIGAILPTVTQIAPHLSAHTILTDVGSVKAEIVYEAEKLLGGYEMGNRFVGGHPMAGTAFNGIQAAELNLFQQRPCVLTPTTNTDHEALLKLRSLWQSVGAVLYECSPEQHDQAVAWISHLPVIVSASLIQACGQESNPVIIELAKHLASSGFRDTSRVGGGNPELGRNMAEYNRSALLTSLESYQQVLQTAIAQIKAENWQELESFLSQSKSDRPNFFQE